MKHDVSKGNWNELPILNHGEVSPSPPPIKKRYSFFEGLASIIRAFKKKRNIRIKRKRTRKDGTYTETEFHYHVDD